MEGDLHEIFFLKILFIPKCVPPLKFFLLFDYFQDFKVYFDVF